MIQTNGLQGSITPQTQPLINQLLANPEINNVQSQMDFSKVDPAALVMAMQLLQGAQQQQAPNQEIILSSGDTCWRVEK